MSYVHVSLVGGSLIFLDVLVHYNNVYIYYMYVHFTNTCMDLF